LGEDFEIGGKMWNFREIWHEMAVNPEFVFLPHEEQPERVNEELFRFLEP
jgi:hypothetical protein